MVSGRPGAKRRPRRAEKSLPYKPYLPRRGMPSADGKAALVEGRGVPFGRNQTGNARLDGSLLTLFGKVWRLAGRFAPIASSHSLRERDYFY